ncbi:IS630 family transposase [Streptomyces sp. LN590]|uniref:IS630 family transposase n=1 Tax=Streptomyces sp. LN590 TaxID=3112980 RepID=UPI00371E003F
MAHPPAAALHLTARRRRRLLAMVGAASCPQTIVLRARIVLLAADGWANRAIAAGLGCSEPTVRRWRLRFKRRGVPGLFDRPRSGRPERHGPSERLAVIAVATSLPPQGAARWTQAMVADHLTGRGLALSRATVRRVLAEAKVRPHKVRGWLNRADSDAFWSQAGAVCRLYLDIPADTLLVSIDEKTGIQARSRIRPTQPAGPGRDRRGGATTPTPSTPATSPAIPDTRSPPRTASRRPHDHHTASPATRTGLATCCTSHGRSETHRGAAASRGASRSSTDLGCRR